VQGSCPDLLAATSMNPHPSTPNGKKGVRLPRSDFQNPRIRISRITNNCEPVLQRQDTHVHADSSEEFWKPSGWRSLRRFAPMYEGWLGTGNVHVLS
jgi:hypothetical protein